jgi:hypothetical protein
VLAPDRKLAGDPERADTDTAFDWQPLGEQRARELGEAAGCTELQLRFGVARFQGASQTRAAALAGYDATGDALRRAGYAALRSTGVQNFLELAAIDAPGSAAISDAEIDAKIAKLIRSSDSNVSLKAMSLHADRQAARASAGGDDPELDPQEALRNEAYGLLGAALGGLLSVAAMHLRVIQKWGPRLAFTALPLFAELAPNVKAEYPEVWARILRALDDDCRAEAERLASAGLADIAALVSRESHAA